MKNKTDLFIIILLILLIISLAFFYIKYFNKSEWYCINDTLLDNAFRLNHKVIECIANDQLTSCKNNITDRESCLQIVNSPASKIYTCKQEDYLNKTHICRQMYEFIYKVNINEFDEN